MSNGSLIDPKSTVFVELDWRAYFYAFMEKHGSSPVNYAGRLLFPDGWMYSDSAYQGPEWEPLPSQVPRLKHTYWKIRHQVLKEEIYYLNNQLIGLERLQLHKDIPLQEQVFDREEGKLKTGNVDFDFLNVQLRLLKEDLETCERKLKEIENDRPKQTVDANGR